MLIWIGAAGSAEDFYREISKKGRTNEERKDERYKGKSCRVDDGPDDGADGGRLLRK